MNKPVKPNITIPAEFATNGVKTDFDNSKLTDGFDRINPDVLAGDNLNKFIDDTYKASNYALDLGDYVLGKDQITNCILEAPNGVATYSGSTITVKEGLKVLIPNGRNADGTLKNIEYTLENDTSFTNTANYKTDFYLFINSNGAISSYGKQVTYIYKYLIDRPQPTSNTYIRCYVLETNKWYTSNNGQPYEEQYLTVIGSWGTNDGNTNIRYLDNFNPTQILTYNNKNEISGWGMPSSKYINLTAGASGSKYTAPANGWLYVAARHWENSNWGVFGVYIYESSVSGSISIYGFSGTRSYSAQTEAYTIPVKKGAIFSIVNSEHTVTAFRFIFAEGEV